MKAESTKTASRARSLPNCSTLCGDEPVELLALVTPAPVELPATPPPVELTPPPAAELLALAVPLWCLPVPDALALAEGDPPLPVPAVPLVIAVEWPVAEPVGEPDP